MACDQQSQGRWSWSDCINETLWAFNWILHVVEEIKVIIMAEWARSAVHQWIALFMFAHYFTSVAEHETAIYELV